MNKNKVLIKKIVFFANLLAIAIVFNYLDALITPGFYRIGLANIISIFVIYIYGIKEGLILVILRVLIVSLIRGTFLGPTFSMALLGALLAVFVMWILKKITPLGTIIVSLIGAITHALGQIVAAMFVLGGASVIAILPFLLLISVPTGILTGLVAGRFLKLYEKNFKKVLKS